MDEAVYTDVLADVMAFRRHLHENPELSGSEKETQKFVISQLSRIPDMKLQFCDGSYAVIATLENGTGGCVAIRADMDALPVEENTGLPFASRNPGVMHACGHDVHTALAIGSALWLSRNRDMWNGTVRWLFEPQEETIGGGQLMTESGCMENVDVVIGQHMNPHYSAGTFYAKAGYVSGYSDTLSLHVIGKGCHGAYPESGVDAIVITAQIVSAIQSLISRTISPFVPAVITFGTIEGGKAGNIICQDVYLKGTLRTLTMETRSKLQLEMKRIAAGIAEAMGGSAEMKITPGYSAVYNNDHYYSIIENTAREILPQEKIVIRDAPSLGVESFCYFTESTPGVYYDIGSGVGTALHTPTFIVDESCILPALRLQCESTVNLLKEINGK